MKTMKPAALIAGMLAAFIGVFGMFATWERQLAREAIINQESIKWSTSTSTRIQQMLRRRPEPNAAFAGSNSK